jgi:hypothetical protein
MEVVSSFLEKKFKKKNVLFLMGSFVSAPVWQLVTCAPPPSKAFEIEYRDERVNYAGVCLSWFCSTCTVIPPPTFMSPN